MECCPSLCLAACSLIDCGSACVAVDFDPELRASARRHACNRRSQMDGLLIGFFVFVIVTGVLVTVVMSLPSKVLSDLSDRLFPNRKGHKDQ